MGDEMKEYVRLRKRYTELRTEVENIANVLRKLGDALGKDALQVKFLTLDHASIGDTERLDLALLETGVEGIASPVRALQKLDVDMHAAYQHLKEKYGDAVRPPPRAP